MQTADLLETIRADLKNGLKQEILAELEPEIQRRLYANIFNFEEARQYLKVSESTLRRMVKEGEVPYFRQRGNIYFRQVDLDKHVANLVKEAKKCSTSSKNVS